MGNCCCPEAAERQTLNSQGRPTQVFQGQGHRLGSADELARYQDKPIPAATDDDNTPAPIYDNDLSEEERAKIRADRAAAAEARLKQQGGLPKKKKASDTPLKGPNSEPLMRWTAG